MRIRKIIILILCALFNVSGISNFTPIQDPICKRIELSRDGSTMFIWIDSSVEWSLYWSKDMKHYDNILNGVPGSWMAFDFGVPYYYDNGFYFVFKRGEDPFAKSSKLASSTVNK